MKRFLAILLATTLLLAMAACGGKPESGSVESGSPAVETAGSEKTESSKASAAETPKPVEQQPKEEKWVRVLEECITSELESHIDGYEDPGDIWKTTTYAYNEKGDVIRQVETNYKHGFVSREIQRIERQYNEHGHLVYSHTIYEESSIHTTSSPSTNEYTYDNNGKIIQKIEKSDGAVWKVYRYEYDGQGRETKRIEADTVSDAESGARLVTVTEYGGEYRSKVTESKYDADNVLTFERYSLYDEYGSLTCTRRTFMAGTDEPSPLDVDCVYERDSRGNILKSTETFQKGTVEVTERSYDEDDHVIEEKVTVTTSAGESGVIDWRTREYEADGHSYTEKLVSEAGEFFGITINDGDVTAIWHYKYLPLSEALAQQESESIAAEEAAADWLGVYRYDDGDEGLLLVVRSANAAVVSGDLTFDYAAGGYGVRSFEWTVLPGDSNAATEPYQGDLMVTYRRQGNSIIAEYPTGLGLPREYTYFCGLEETEKYIDRLTEKQESSAPAAAEFAPDVAEMGDVYVGPYGSTITMLTERGNLSTWDMVLTKGEDRYEDRLEFSLENNVIWVSSVSGEFNGMAKATGDSYEISFNQSETMFKLGPEYGVMEFVRK